MNLENQMNNFQQIKLGLKSYSQAFSFIFKNKLGWTLLIPVILNIILFAVAQNYIIELINYIKGFVEDWSLMTQSSGVSPALWCLLKPPSHRIRGPAGAGAMSNRRFDQVCIRGRHF